MVKLMSVFLHFYLMYNNRISDCKNEEIELINVLKEMIQLNIKPNFAVLGREYGCDYRTAKAKFYKC